MLRQGREDYPSAILEAEKLFATQAAWREYRFSLRWPDTNSISNMVFFVGEGFIPSRSFACKAKTGGDKPRPYEEGNGFIFEMELE
jgi:hypothetical protein